MIISRTAEIRSGSKNMCSVRHSPIPSAPNSRATFASLGVSAFARTPSLRTASAHDRNFLKYDGISGSTVGTRPSITSPADPSSVMYSPRRTTAPLADSVPAP